MFKGQNLIILLLLLMEVTWAKFPAGFKETVSPGTFAPPHVMSNMYPYYYKYCASTQRTPFEGEGGGIGGFENLIIIKHSSELLSAYSFNGGVEVTEQQMVKSGDVLARIKPVSERGESVHFEIRRNGRPIDPKTLIKASI